jgi:hypothetical protein
MEPQAIRGGGDSMRPPVRKPSEDIRDIRRAVAQLCDLTEKLRISESSTVAVDEGSNCTMVNVKQKPGGGSPSAAQVWI